MTAGEFFGDYDNRVDITKKKNAISRLGGKRDSRALLRGAFVMIARIAVVVLLTVAVARPCHAHNPQAQYQTGAYTVAHDSGGADHTHNLRVYADLASPGHGATYTQTYLGGNLPIRSGSVHKAEFITSRGCSPCLSWIASVGPGSSSGGSEVVANELVTPDQNGVFERIFLLDNDFSLAGAEGFYPADAKAQLVDCTIEPNAFTEYIEHVHLFEVVE